MAAQGVSPCTSQNQLHPNSIMNASNPRNTFEKQRLGINKQGISRENSMLVPETTRETVNVTRVTAVKKGITKLNNPV